MNSEDVISKTPAQKCGSFWLGWLDSDQRMTESKSVALPLGDIPKYGVSDETRTRDTQSHNLVLYQLNYAHHMVYLKGFEPLTHGLEGRCSIQLS